MRALEREHVTCDTRVRQARSGAKALSLSLFRDSRTQFQLLTPGTSVFVSPSSLAGLGDTCEHRRTASQASGPTAATPLASVSVTDTRTHS